MNKVPSDLIYEIASYLLPRDVMRFRYLSRQYCDMITVYLLRTFKQKNLYELICPLCSNDWVSTFKIYPNDFLDIDEEYDYFEIIERNDHISKVFGSKKVKRDHLLCNECEDILHKDATIRHFKINKNIQVYIDLFSNSKWVYLVRETSKGIIWNQYNCMVHHGIV
jgi:hypothetical protein